MYITIKYTVYLIVTFKLIRKNMNESCFVAEMLLRMCNDAYLCYVQCKNGGCRHHGCQCVNSLITMMTLKNAYTGAADPKADFPLDDLQV